MPRRRRLRAGPAGAEAWDRLLAATPAAAHTHAQALRRALLRSGAGGGGGAVLLLGASRAAAGAWRRPAAAARSELISGSLGVRSSHVAVSIAARAGESTGR